MAALSWNEIRQRAIQFSRDWKGETSERAVHSGDQVLLEARRTKQATG